MSTKQCECCGTSFTPRAQVPDQAYCSRPQCQRERRQRWNREKLQTDPDYVDNKRRAQRAWLDHNPNYWRDYRAKNPKSTDTSRGSLRKKDTLSTDGAVAKRDASSLRGELAAGIYRLTPVLGHGESHTWLFEICPV